ncbi:MAG TPA: hypothetical protein VLF63_02055, partial [Patescibacteria group bacterium]|nr:hypothetical protein [Patescibacteria group bacterium]
MISFVWAEPLPLYSGRGGSETYTVGQVRELLDRGIKTRIITVGLGKRDGRDYFPDIPFFDVKQMSDLSKLKDTLVFVNQPPLIKTVHHSFLIMHCQPPSDPKLRDIYLRATSDKSIIANSKSTAKLWAEYLGIRMNKLTVVYPFADPVFSKVRRLKRSHLKTQILYAGRLTPEKGIYLILESLHHKVLRRSVNLTITTAGNQTTDGRIIEKFLRVHDWIKVVQATSTPQDTAKL